MPSPIKKHLLGIIAVFLVGVSSSSAISTPIDEETPWPRVRSTNGCTVTIHLPQVERWTSNWFSARAAVEVKLPNPKSDLFGAIWFEAHGSVDRTNRIVTLDRLEITKGNFPDAKDKGSNAMAVIRSLLPSGARTISLDYLVTSLGFAESAARQGPNGLKSEPPQVFWVTNRTVLIRIDGEPFQRPIPDTSLERVVNTPEFLLFDKTSSRFYLAGEGHWFTASSIKDQWSVTRDVPAEVAALSPPSTTPEDQPPQIIVTTAPAELLTTSGLPDFRPIRGTALQYAADSDSQLFFHTGKREAYLLLSGRWFKASSLKGPWTYVPPRELPDDFARIPSGIPQAIVLASVPDTREAGLAVLANSVPTTTTVGRRDAQLQFEYDGEPQFKPIEGTTLTYAVNAQLPVILSSANYYALDNGVWFVAASAKGPWAVAVEVPDEIYSIPPSSPVYYATFARIYDADEEEVEVGYTGGYQGTYEDDGTVVYGTGYDYQPWYGEQYYGWGWTWGYGYTYVPWYQWWVWRPWWTPPGGLRAAIIENIYDRWQGGNQVTPYNRPVATQIAARSSTLFSGYPALYGRHWPSAPSAPSARSAPSAGSAGSAASAASAARAASAASAPSALSARSALSAPQAPPANTLALNPYSRPETPIASGDVPRGAQMLSAVRQAPGGGRDLYASPDGGVYQRRNDGWYRRQPGGGWNFYAPTEGTIARNEAVAAARAQNLGRGQLGAGNVYRPVAAQPGAVGRAAIAANRIPNAGGEQRAQQVAALERQYYARAIAQMRAQNFRAGNAARGGRGGGGRRR